MTSFWENRRVFLTGHTGFKGGWLSLWLQSLGCDVTGFSLPPSTSPNFFEVARVSENMHSVFGDVRNLTELSAAIEHSQPEIVIHMAAQALVRQSYLDPVTNFSTNIMGTVNILEVVRQLGTVKAFINVTTDKCYKNQEKIEGYCENDPLGGFDPYSNSKACSELVTASYRDSFFSCNNLTSNPTSIATARGGNVIGGGDWSPDRLVPDILRSLQNHQKIIIRNPYSVRPWQHVFEALNGYLILAQKLYQNPGIYDDAWNFGPAKNNSKNVIYIAEKMNELWGENSSWELAEEKSNLHETNALTLNACKAKNILGWTPLLSIDETLEVIISWHKAYLNGEDMRDISVYQISQYRLIMNNAKF